VQPADASGREPPLTPWYYRCGMRGPRRLRMLMFKRTQLYIALALAGLAELLVRAAVR